MPRHTEEERRKKKRREQESPELQAERELVASPDFVRQREKRAQALIQQGLSERAAREQAGQAIRAGEVPKLQADIEAREAEAVKFERESIAKSFLEERGFFEEEQPVRRGLDIGRAEGLAGTIEGIPVLGAGAAVIGNILMELTGAKEEERVLLEDPETRREFMLNEIQKQTIKEGLSAGEHFGSFIESIPIVGTLAAKYASGLIEDPRTNVATVLREIDSERERASVLAENLRSGKIDPFTGFDVLQTMENNIFHLEQRIKLLANSSPQLRKDADAINKIEERILRAKERVFMAKAAAAQGIVAEPTLASTFFTLRDLKK